MPQSSSDTSQLYRFDAFVSYRHGEPDETWVRHTLTPFLEAAGLLVCVDVRDFSPGMGLLDEMERAVVQSRFTVAVLSPRYLESRFAHLENVMADQLGIEEGGRRLILVCRERCSPGIRLRSRIWLDMSNDNEFGVSGPRLIAALRRGK